MGFEHTPFEMTGALNQRLRPLGHATDYMLYISIPLFLGFGSKEGKQNPYKNSHIGSGGIRTHAIEMTGA